MPLTRIDAADSSAFDQWFELMSRSDGLHTSGDYDGWHPDEIRVRASDDSAGSLWHMLAHHFDGQMVAISWLEVHTSDNTHTLRGDFMVDPELRRRGYGTRAIAETEEYARSLGRSEIVIAAHERQVEIRNGPNRYFAPRVGYSLLDESARRDIAWPRPDGEFDQLDARWTPSSVGYSIEAWPSPSPDSALDDLAHLVGIMPVEAPHGDLEIVPEVWNAARVRAYEKRADDMGRDLFVAVARHSESGRLVAFSQLTCSRTQPSTAYQWDTLVMRAHRGHRLGGLMKVANMRQLENSGHDVRRISTFNSISNTPMIEVNVALGGVLVESRTEWRKVFSRDGSSTESTT